MQTKHLFLLPALAFLACAGLQAQVTIGGLIEPARGAILDLNSTVKGGLLLSNVTLTDLRTIPAEISEADAINTETTKKAQFTGAMVYHIGGNDIAAGVYVWNGKRWGTFGGAPTVKDAEGHEYSIAKFGAAGWWMTENLRTTGNTYDVDGTTSTPLVKNSDASYSDTEPRYTYPRVDGEWDDISDINRDSVFRAHEHYGLLYNWAAASGRTDGPGDDTNGLTTSGTTLYRGVCPEGWHLPSDWEWSELEKEIALNPWEYSTQDVAYTFPVGYGNLYSMTAWRPSNGDNSISSHQKYWGRQMKSTELVGTTINTYGTSEPRAKGGFDALLVGTVDINGTADAYGSHTVFWSSSSNSGGIGSSSYGFFSVNRHLDSGYTGMARDYTYRGHLFSVRCKKDD